MNRLSNPLPQATGAMGNRHVDMIARARVAATSKCLCQERILTPMGNCIKDLAQDIANYLEHT